MPKTNVTGQMTTHTISLSYELLEAILRHINPTITSLFIYIDLT